MLRTRLICSAQNSLGYLRDYTVVWSWFVLLGRIIYTTDSFAVVVYKILDIISKCSEYACINIELQVVVNGMYNLFAIGIYCPILLFLTTMARPSWKSLAHEYSYRVMA